MSENESPEVNNEPESTEEFVPNPEDGTEEDDDEQERRKAARDQHDEGGSAA